MIKLNINGETMEIEAAPEKPLLWVLRENLGLNGTKFGCGIGQCGACTVHIDGNPIRSCSLPVSAAKGRNIRTIEGLKDGEDYHPIQAAWVAEQVPQCGYCQSGQIMSAVSLLERNPNPSDKDIDEAMSGNICRCGMYGRIRKAIKTAAKRESNISSDQAVGYFDPKDNGDTYV